MLELAKATHLDLAPAPDGGGAAAGDEVAWAAHLDEQWSIGPKLHGGYLLAVLATAAAGAVSSARPDHVVPQAVTSTFLRAPEPGPADVVATVLRTGRSVSSVRTTLRQGGTPCVEAVLTLGPHPEPVRPALAPEPVAVTPFEECPRSPAGGQDGRGRLPIMDVVDVRLDPATAGFLRGAPTGAGRLSGWVVLEADPAWTPAALLVALDALPPATFDLGGSGWSPTISLSAHVHADAAPGPLRATQWVDWAAGDRMHESCLLWDATGRLVGQAQQLAAVRG